MLRTFIITQGGVRSHARGCHALGDTLLFSYERRSVVYTMGLETLNIDVKYFSIYLCSPLFLY